MSPSSRWMGLRCPGTGGFRGVIGRIAGLSLVVSALHGPALLQAQQGAVAGEVVSSRSLQPVSGAIVSIAGTTTRATTDTRGHFRLVTPSSSGSVNLQVTMIGFRPLTATVTAGDDHVRLTLAESAVELSELVVTGTVGATEKRSVGNSVARVRVSEESEVSPALSLDQLLNARAPGVVVVPPSGLTGSGARIFIRGRSSISLPTDPLIYVDGIRVDKRAPTGANAGNGTTSGLNDFNPEDIESLEIIKGPAAGTLYGTEANNGVIQIITKRGRPGPAKVDVSIREGVNWIMDPAGRWPLNYYIDPTNNSITPFNLYQAEADAGRPLFRNGFAHGYSVSIAGGSDASLYYGGVTYSRDEGAQPNNTAQRFGGRVNVSMTPNAKFDINGQMGFASNRTKFPDAFNGLLFDAILSRPGNRNSPTRGFYTAPQEVWNRNFSFNENLDHLTTGVEVRHRPTSWLSHRVRAGLDISNNDGVDLTLKMSPDDAQFFAAATAAGAKTVNQINTLNTTVDYSATATTSFWKHFSSSTTGGFQFYRRNTRLLSATGEQFPAADVTSVAGAAIQRGSDDAVESITVGGFVQEQISFKNRVYLTAALRRDRNSAFGATFGAATYPKLSLSWVLNEEPFFKVPIVNTLRLRAAYGKSGQQPDAFASLRTYQPITGQAGLPAATPQFVGNPDLGPERGKEYELGFEAGLFNQRLGIDFTYYNKTTDNAIVLRNVAPSTGFPEQSFVNAGQVKNKGVEVLVNGRVIESKNLAWDLTLNVSHNDNKVTQLGIPNTPYLEFGFGNRFQPGYPVYAFFARKVVSADRLPNGSVNNIKCDGGTPSGMPGGAPVDCASAPRVYRGAPEPSLEGSIGTNLTFKGRLTFAALVDFKRNWTTWDSNLWCPGILSCESEAYPDRFSTIRVASDVLGYTDDFAWEPDLSFAKLREVSVSYSMPDRWARTVGAKRAVITAAGRNLHTWTNYHPGLDPENISSFAETFKGFGTPFSQNQLPQAAQFVMRVNLTY
ncbi:MAG: SusC/RagA family TonB-linked outer membrane protein [Gemmatimonadota bacterium]